MEKKVQKMRFSDAELSLVKNTFSENDDLLKAIRKVFLQIPLDAVDKDVLSSQVVGKPEVIALLRKCYLPEIDPNAPVHQVIDLWMTVDLKDKSPEQAWPVLASRDLLIKYLDQQLKVLEKLDEDSASIRFDAMSDIHSNKNIDTAYIDMITRNTLISHNEQQLQQLAVLAGQREETVEQTKERLKKDSSK